MEKCCAEALDRIQLRIESEKALKLLMEASPALMALGYKFTGASLVFKLLQVPVQVAIIRLREKSPKFRHIVNLVPIMAREAICKDCSLHLLDHQNDPPAEDFWEDMQKFYGSPS